MTEFSLDWPHGWQTRNGSEKLTHFIGKMRDGTLVFETRLGRTWCHYPNGRCFHGVDDEQDIINAPAPKPEPRKWWVVMFRVATKDMVFPEYFCNEKDAQKLMDRHDVVPIAFTCITEGDGLGGSK